MSTTQPAVPWTAPRARRPFHMLAIAVLASCMLTAGRSSADCVSAVSVAEFQTSGPHAGEWKYTLSVSWSGVQQGASNFTFVLGLDTCPCVCEDGMWTFDTPAGTSTGADPATGAPCVAQYVGEFNCQGNPSVPEVQGPSLQWATTAGCDPGMAGDGTLTFYSPNAPTGPSTGDFWLKAGPGACLGVISGQLPGCTACALPVEPRTWGEIKSLYR